MTSQSVIVWLAGLLCVTDLAVGAFPSMGPFFFLCNYNGNTDQSSLDSGEVSLSVSIDGNPDYYVPGKSYLGE